MVNGGDGQMGVYRARIRAGVIGAAGLAAALALAAAPALAATSNLVGNPSGVGGSTTGWSAPSGWGPLTGVQVGGVSWFKWVSDNAQSHNPGPGSAWYSYQLSNVQPGQQVSCGFKAMGTGSIMLDLWTGQNGGDHLTAPVTLSSTPQTLTETETIGAQPWVSPPQVQVRYQNATGNLTIYFTDVTCVLGTSVTLVADSTGTASGSTGTASGSTGTASGSTGTASGSTGTSTASKTGSTAPTTSTSSLPKTGGGPLPLVGGLMALAGGTALLLRRRTDR